MENELIVVRQLPIIEQQLRLVSQEIDNKVSTALEYKCDENTIKIIKDMRATLNKEAKDWEEKRKRVKDEIMKPYNDFEAIYKENIIDKYRKADAELKTKIDNVEYEVKRRKLLELETYFKEYALSQNVDFIKFSDLSICITLSTSMKSYKEQVKNYIDKIVDDLKLINTQEYKAEILVEYKKSKNVSEAITIVINRFKAIEEEKAKLQRKEDLQKEIIKIAEESDKYVPTVEEVEQVILEPPTAEEEILILSFKVKATRAKLKALKEFLNNGGYMYE